MARRYLKDFDKGAHSVYLLYYHLVVCTKYRRQIISEDISKVIYECLSNTCNDYNGRLIEFNGESDHIHALINLPPTCKVSELIGRFKGRAAYTILRLYPAIKNQIGRDGVFWSPSYCLLTTGGAPIDVIKRYIQSQTGFDNKDEMENYLSAI